MKWNLIKESSYTVELPFPQRVKGHIIDKRYGILAQLSNGVQSATVEISPFQGFLDTPLSLSIEEFKWDLEKTDIPEFKSFIDYVDYFRDLNLSPSSFFAFIQLADQILSYHSTKKITNDGSDNENENDNENDKEKVKLNKLLSFEQFQGLLPAQLETTGKVKIKIHRESVEEVVQALSAYDVDLFEYYFRLDMNGSWTKDKLLELWEQLLEHKKEGLIDYFEEPFATYEEYKDLSSEIPLMHEECMADYLKEPNQALGLVYKPSQVPWPTPMPKRLVISSCWEGPHGLSALKRLATLYPQEFHGLGAHIEYPALEQE